MYVCMYVHTRSYRDNPSMGDPNTLMEELLEMRNKIRISEVEMVMKRAKVSERGLQKVHVHVGTYMYVL